MAETIGDVGKMSKREAESIRRERQVKMGMGVVKPDRPRKITLAQYLIEDRLAHAPDVKPTTLLEYDHAAAHAHNPVLERYVPAVARFLREAPVPLHHLRYEELVSAPRESMEGLCDFLDIAFEEGMIEYGRSASGRAESVRGLGDPVTVAREQRPTTDPMSRWTQDFAGNAPAIDQAEKILARLLDEDLATWGFDRARIAAELDGIDRAGAARQGRPLTRYALERRRLVRLRRTIHHNALGRLVRRVRRICDVLLR